MTFKLTEQQVKIVSKISNLLTEEKVNPKEGEELLLWMAGLSAGIRQQSIVGDWLKPAALAWTFGAEEGYDL